MQLRVIQRDQSRMIQGGEHGHLAAGALGGGALLGLRAEHLDGDRAPEQRVLRAVHARHPALPDALPEVVATIEQRLRGKRVIRHRRILLPRRRERRGETPL